MLVEWAMFFAAKAMCCTETKGRCICLSHDVPETTHHGVLKAKTVFASASRIISLEPYDLVVQAAQGLSFDPLSNRTLKSKCFFCISCNRCSFPGSNQKFNKVATNSTAKYSKMCHSNPM